MKTGRKLKAYYFSRDLYVIGFRCFINYILLLNADYHNTVYIVLDSMYETMSISTGLYPNLDLWNANKLHYINIYQL